MQKLLQNNLVKISELLSNQQCHDRNSIGQALNITRTAVWKAINKLKKYQIKINSLKGKGYSMPEPLLLLDYSKIFKHFSADKIDLDILESVSSTNDYLQNVKSNKPIKICLAEHQSQGRGRLNREWHSPFGKNIYLSCSYPFHKDVSSLAGLSLVISLALIKTLNQYGIGENLYVKWPNDIFYDGKKLAGILVELHAETHGTCYAIIGIGINVNMSNDENAAITQPWSSLNNILNRYVDRNDLSVQIIKNLLDYLNKFDHHGLSIFVNEWMKADYLMNQKIILRTLSHSIEGVAKGINHQGHLLVKLEDGLIKPFSSGDASVRKID